jgi:predicted DNA-binding transcriptional regulator AlpA
MEGQVHGYRRERSRHRQARGATISSGEGGAGLMPEVALLRLPQVLALIPVSRSTWWAGVKSGRFPAPVKIGPRTTAWRAVDIRALFEQLTGPQLESGAHE